MPRKKTFDLTNAAPRERWPYDEDCSKLNLVGRTGSVLRFGL